MGFAGIEPAPFRLYVYLKFVCTFTVAPACLLQSGRSRFATVRVKNWEFEIKLVPAGAFWAQMQKKAKHAKNRMQNELGLESNPQSEIKKN